MQRGPGPAISQFCILCCRALPAEQVLGLLSGSEVPSPPGTFSQPVSCKTCTVVPGTSYKESAHMAIHIIGAVGSSPLNAVLYWSRRRWEVGITSSTKWTIFLDSCRQSFVKWNRTVFYFWLETLLWVSLSSSLFAAAGCDFICLISFDDEQAETTCFCGEDCVYFWQRNPTIRVSVTRHKHSHWDVSGIAAFALLA